MSAPVTTPREWPFAEQLFERIRWLARDVSAEITPAEAPHAALLAALMPAGSRVYITHLPGPGLEGTAEAARALADVGLRPVPHIAARSVTDLEEVDQALATMVAESGVDDVLVIAGALAEPGPFTSTAELLDTGVLLRHGIRSLGVAGHPEGSADIPANELAAALRWKQAYAERTGSRVRLVTQFTFAAEPLVAWERSLRRAGIRLPIHVGLPGATGTADLIRFGVRCGIGPSLKVLRQQGRRLLHVAATRHHYPDATVLGVARASAEDPASLFDGLHLFPFGALERTAAWAAELRAGHFQITEGGLITPSRHDMSHTDSRSI